MYSICLNVLLKYACFRDCRNSLTGSEKAKNYRSSGEFPTFTGRRKRQNLYQWHLPFAPQPSDRTEDF